MKTDYHACMSVTIDFLGGADTVTGSKYLVRHQDQQLLVDCGLFQGYKQLRLRNWAEPAFNPVAIGAVVLTHAHLDHSGYLPLLVRKGYEGRIHATPATRDLCAILLPDSGHIQEEDARFANRHCFSKHQPAEPLYTRSDALNCMPHFKTHEWGQWFEPLPGWKARFSEAGHILGASSLYLEVAGHRILFSGDLGRPDDELMRAPQDPPAADTVLIESTYGNRTHPEGNLEAELLPLLKKVSARGGVAVLPVFAVGRAQMILHMLARYKTRGDLPHGLPVFLDSPMASHTTALFARHIYAHKLEELDMRAMGHAAHMIETPEESKALALRHGPMIILAASGMATGGRVLHHLERYAPDHRNLIVLTGHQSEGTRGARLASGSSTIRMHGRDVPVRAEVVQLESASAHADAQELLNWLSRMPQPPAQVYVVHGEREASDTLRQRIERELHWRALVPEHNSTLQA